MQKDLNLLGYVRKSLNMKNFIYENPTKIVFGKNAVQGLGKEAAKFGKKALFVYGKESIKKSGLYTKVLELLMIEKIAVVEHGGVKGNPVYTHTREGIKKGLDHKVDMLIAVGGGSVIDEAKAIACTLAGDDFWEILSKGKRLTKCLPILTVQTLPATGSEMNGAFVVTKEDSLEKYGTGGSVVSHPKVSFLDPEYTLTISLKQTAYAVADMMSHLMEGYLTTSAEDVIATDSYIEGILHSIMICAKRLAKNPQDLEARASLMWSASLAWNGTGLLGLPNIGLPCHALEHQMSALYDIAHGGGLSMVTPAWMKYFSARHEKRIIKLGKNVFGLKKPSCADVISALENFYKEICAPTTWADENISKPDIKKLTEIAGREFNYEEDSPAYSRHDVEKIYKLIPLA